MKNVFVIFFLVVISCFNCFSSVLLNCKVRYLTQIYHEPTYFEGTITGKNLFTPGYYENIWSNFYQMDVMFYSGLEANSIIGKDAYSNNDILALVTWKNGSSNTIVLTKKTYSKVLSLTDFSKIKSLDGIDSDQRTWNIIISK